MKIKNLPLAYVKQHRMGIALYVFLIIIFLSVFFLYRIPFEPIGYGTLLSFFFASITISIDYRHYRKKQETLNDCRNHIVIGMEHLPEPAGLTEEQYQGLLKIMLEERKEKLAEVEQEKNGLTEYFTLWAHQIKTPIAAMGLLLEEIEEEYEWKLEMDSELFKIRQYVDMVLQYLRLGSSVNDFVFREYELDHMIKQAVHKYASMFIRKKLRLSYGSIDIKVVTDEKWLVFVLEQVLSNAIKYTKEGTISIYMEAGSEKVLVIEDSGIGIFPEDLPRVFEAGYTGYNGRRDKKATGIGLYLCREVLRKLSHRFLLESEPGKGTRVLLDFSQNLQNCKE